MTRSSGVSPSALGAGPPSSGRMKQVPPGSAQRTRRAGIAGS